MARRVVVSRVVGGPAASDGGSGAELVLCGGDRLAALTQQQQQRRAVDRVRKRVKRNAPECAEVLSLILRFGRDRGKSIAEMSAQDEPRWQGGRPSDADKDMKHRLKVASNRYFRQRGGGWVPPTACLG